MEDLTGKQLGPYQIVAPLGEGGMAAVYRAYQPGMERYVALKILPRHFADDPEFVGRFEQEAKLIARLQHVHILPVHDYGQADGYTYIVMPYVETGTLADLMAGDPLPMEQVQGVITQIGDALDYAHERGLVHRDVKPSNILIDDRGNCLLTDFGIAKMVESTAQFTQTGAIIGTPAYMSPEQILGEELDGRSDIYSLGIVLFEMATGRPPYRAETPPAIFVKHLNDPLPLPHALNPQIPDRVERVILKSLAKDRQDRYATSIEMAEALAAAAEDSGLDESAVADLRPTRDEARGEAAAVVGDVERKGEPRRTWLLALGGAVVVLAIAGGAYFAGKGTPATRPPEPLPSEIPASPMATDEGALPYPPTAAPETPRPAGPAILWRYTAPDVIWQLDSWGDGHASGDLDQDDTPDLAFGTRNGMVVILSGAGGEPIWTDRITAKSDSPVEADIIDLNGDGQLEVVAAGFGDPSSGGEAILRTYDAEGGLKWEAVADYEAIVDLAYNDVSGDGVLEVIASAGTYPWGGGQVVVFDGSSGARIWSASLGTGQAQGIDAGDLDGDGVVEIAVENYDNRVFLLAGDTGKIRWSQSKNYHGRDVLLADVDDDGALEVLSAVANAVAFDFRGSPQWRTGSGGDFIAVGDLTGDGATEVIYSSAFGGDLHVIRGKTGEELWTKSRAGVHAVGDVDGDGVVDLVTATIRYYGIEPPYAVEAVRGDADPIWSFPLETIFNESPFALTLANLDDDPALEVVVANGRELIALDTQG